MGYNHVGTGLIAGVATLQFVPLETPLAKAAWVVVAGGAALLPDLDSQHSTVSRMWGSISGLLSDGMALLAGGHRQGTHDLVLAPLATGLLFWAAGLHPWSAMAALALVIGVSIRGLCLASGGRIGAGANLLTSWGFAWWLASTGTALPALLPLVAALGVAVHILGDFLTDEGVPVPVVWLFGVDQRLSAGLFRTGRLVESLVVGPAVLAGLVWTVFATAGIVDVSSTMRALSRLVS